jgi:regulator of protease activity HflC (stomatin/prohibitin superfamily)
VASNDSFFAKYGSRAIVFIVGVGLFVILVVYAIDSMGTPVENTQVAIVVNNVTGAKTIHNNGGLVMHLPFGLSSVYKIDKAQLVLALTQEHKTREHPDGDQVNIKTNDGSNVEMDIEVIYEINPANAEQAYRELGTEPNIETILRALTRSEIRSELGQLSTLDIAEAVPRNAKLDSTKNNLQALLGPLSIEIDSINAKNFRFDPEYDRIIKERKETDQILTNQKDYQAQALETGNRKVAEANRDKETSLAQLKGELSKKLLTAEGEAKRKITEAETQRTRIEREVNADAMIAAAEGDAQRTKTKAQQTAIQLAREGEIALKTADQQSAATLAEGQRKAEAMEKLLEGYSHGGEGLVKEAIIKLYEGVKIHARPYAPSDRVDQLQVKGAAEQLQVKGLGARDKGQGNSP